MNFNVIKNINLIEEKEICIIIHTFEQFILSYTGNQINQISSGYINSMLHYSNCNGTIGTSLFLYDVPNFTSKHIIIIGCGKQVELNHQKYRQVILHLKNILNNTSYNKFIYFINEIPIKKQNQYWKIRYTIETINDLIYNFYISKNKEKYNINKTNQINFYASSEEEFNQSKEAIKHANLISQSIKYAKDLANMPPNICNPNYLSNQVKKISNNKEVNISIIDEKEIKEIGMTAYLAVGQGSSNKPSLSIIEYKGNNININPIIFIGKGVTFDTGGISIKPSHKLDEMKYDMCGAAAVYGILHFAISMKLPLNIIGILAGCENMISNQSLRPGDIIYTLSGKTIEIINTDAEGRLILCDVLTYINKYNPEIVIDIATLTGACVVALGHQFSGLMSNNQKLANDIIKASKQSKDYVWQLPITKHFQKQLQSDCADIKNISNQAGEAIAAGSFLSIFTTQYHWAHLDIAGTAWTTKNKKLATGRPIALLAQFLLNRSKYINKK